MNITKAKELIAELELDIADKLNALNALRVLVARESGADSAHVSATPSNVVPMSLVVDESDSYVDLAVKIIESRGGAPMRVADIVRQIRTLKGNMSIERRSVESTLYQHVKAKGENSRVVKAGRAMYGVRRYPRVQNSA